MKIKSLAVLVIMVAMGMLLVAIVMVHASAEPTLVVYTISNRTIIPPQTTSIDVEFSETVKAWIKIEDTDRNLVNELYHSPNVKNPTSKTWDGTNTTGVQVPDGVYYVNVTGTNTTTNLSVVNNTETITVMSPVIISIVDTSAPPDGNVTAPVMINNVTDLGSGTINITFNSSVVHVINVASGTGNAFYVQDWNVDNNTGIVRIVAWNASGPRSGNVIFANVTYKAVGSELKSSPLNISVRDLTDYYNYTQIPHTINNGTFTITDIIPPLVTNPTANPDTIPNSGNVYSQLNVTVTDPSGIASVTVNLSSIGGASTQSMNRISGTDIWTITTNATKGYGLQNLAINATDNAGYSNTSVSILLNITDATKPIPSNIGANRTEAGMPVLFSAYWTDDVGLANYTFAWNDTGVWENDSIVEMTGTGNWSNVTKTLNTTLKTIGWRIYACDTSGNLNDTGILVLTINDTIKPVLTNLSANPDTILRDTGRARPHGTNGSRLNVSVTEIGSGISNVTINLSVIGGSAVQPMERIEGTDIWTVTRNATLGINLTNELVIRATDNAGNSNTSVIYLTVLRRGDVVRDNNISSADAFYIAKYLVGKESMPSMLVGDVVPATGDGKITSGDALYIAKYLVEKEAEP